MITNTQRLFILNMSISHNISNPIGARASSQFSSPQEEIDYLKNKLDESQREFLEFQESSRELETEYETQVRQLESKTEDYLNQLNKLEIENDQLKSKYSAYTNDTQHKLNQYQEQLTELQALNTRLTSYIRELEQNNDDLERARRALAASLEDFESQLNQQIERNVLLENEVSEKEELECVVQRLKEETRDLKHELTVHSKQNDSARRKQLLLETNNLANSLADSSLQSSISPTRVDVSINANASNTSQVIDQVTNNNNNNNDSILASQSLRSPSTTVNGSVQAKPSMVDSTTSPPPQSISSQFSFPPTTATTNQAAQNKTSDQQQPSTPKSTDTKSQQTSENSSPSRPAMVMTPSTRLSALNLVSDLLRKVVSLESKLSSAKKVTTPQTS